MDYSLLVGLKNESDTNYLIGIIDIFTYYSVKKKAAHLIKSI